MAFLYEKIINKIKRSDVSYDLCSYDIKSLGYNNNLIGFKITIDDQYCMTDDTIKFECAFNILNNKFIKQLELNKNNINKINEFMLKEFNDCFKIDINDLNNINFKNLDIQNLRFLKEFNLNKFTLNDGILIGPNNSGDIDILNFIK